MKNETQSEGLSGCTGAGLGFGTGVMHHSAGTTSFMNNNSSMIQRPGVLPGSAPGQCRQLPAYKVAAQMARLHRLGRAHSHEGVTYRTNHEDGTAVTPNTQF